MGLAPSSYYFQPVIRDERALGALVEQVAREYPCYGYRRVTVQLRREKQVVVNHKKVLQLLRLSGLLVRRQRRVRTTDSTHGWRRYPNLLKRLKVERPEQVWGADITYVRLAKGFVYLAVVLDVYSRSMRGWALSRSLDDSLPMAALRMALEKGKPAVHHSDQGGQYCSEEYVAALVAANVAISMAGQGKPRENAHVERWIRTLKEEEVYLSEYSDYAEAQVSIGKFIEEVYNRKRIHSSLGYLTPEEYEGQYHSGHDQHREQSCLDCPDQTLLLMKAVVEHGSTEPRSTVPA